MYSYLQKVLSRKTCFKISFLLASCRSMTKIAGSGSESGSISKRHGSADSDPDPHQNVMDPEHWFIHCHGHGYMTEQAARFAGFRGKNHGKRKKEHRRNGGGRYGMVW
jgi:hypothetical protein